MVLLSLHGLAPARIAELVDCHLATVRRWIGRFNDEEPGRAGGPVPVRAAGAGRAAAPGPDHRAAGRAGPVDPAADPPVPGLSAGTARGRCTGGCGWWRSGGGRS